MTYRWIGDEVCRVNGKLACWATFRQGEKIRYVITAGRKGKGRVLAKAICTFGYRDEERAKNRIEKKIGKVVFPESD